MRTLWLPPLASEPNSLHGMRSRLVRELPDGRGLRQCPSDRTHATPGIHVAAYADRFALSYHLPVGVLRPLGLDLHLTRHSPVVLGKITFWAGFDFIREPRDGRSRWPKTSAGPKSERRFETSSRPKTTSPRPASTRRSG